MTNSNQFIIKKKINKFVQFRKVIYINCRKYENTKEVMKYLWKHFKMPKNETFSIDAFLDWFTDESYLKETSYIFILKNFDEGFNKQCDQKRELLEMFTFDSIFWWEQDVKVIVVEGKPKKIDVIIETKILEQIKAVRIVHRFPVSVEKIDIADESNDIHIMYTYYDIEQQKMDCEIKLENIMSYYQVAKTDNLYTQYLISNFYRKIVELDDRYLVWLTEDDIYCFIKK